MATAEKYAEWIVANKDKKGTPEFDTVAKAYQLAKQETTGEPVASATPSALDRFNYARKSATDLVENLQTTLNVGVLGGAEVNPVDDFDYITPDEYLEEGIDYTLKEKMQRFSAYRQSLIDSEYQDIVEYNTLKQQQKAQQTAETKTAIDKILELDFSGLSDAIAEADIAGIAGSAVGSVAPEELAITALKLPAMMATGGLLGGSTEGTRQLATGEDLDVGRIGTAAAIGTVAPAAFVGAGKVIVAAAKPTAEASKKIVKAYGTNVKPRIEALTNKVEAKIRNKPVTVIQNRKANDKIAKIEEDMAVIMSRDGVDGFTAMDQALKKNGVNSEGLITLQTIGTRGVEIPSPEQAAIVARRVANRRGKVGNFRDQYIRPVASLIKELNPTVYNAMKKAELQKLKLSAEAFDIIGVMATRIKALSPEDSADFAAALFNRNIDAAIAIAKRANNGLENSVANVRNLLDTLHKNLEATGLNVKYLEDYFPRYVKDLDGLRKALGSKGANALDRALDATAKRLNLPSRDLLDQEDIATTVAKYMRDAQPEQVARFKSQRLVESQERDFFANYYEDPIESVARYTTKALDEITKRRFFGNESYTLDGGVFDIDGTLANYVAKNLLDKKMSTQEVADLKLNLKYVFDTPQSGRAAAAIKDLSYLATLGQLSSSLIQLGDVGTVAFLNGLRPTIEAMIQKFSGKSAYKVSDIGLYNKIQADITKEGFGRWLDKTFQVTGFAKLDRFGKEVAMNASINKWSKKVQTQKGTEEFAEKWGDVFGDDFNRVVRQLREGRRTEDTEYLAFLELSRIQPVTKSEMPLKYLDSPNGRIMYTLKSYALKQLDLIREEIIKDFKQGKIAAGIQKSIWHGMTIGLANASVQTARDALLGKDVDEDTFGDEFANAYTTMLFMSRFDREKYLAQGDVVGFVANQLVPPIFDIAAKGLVATGKSVLPAEDPQAGDKSIDKFYKTVVTKLPVGGELAYNRVMGGSENYNEDLRKKREAERKKVLGF